MTPVASYFSDWVRLFCDDEYCAESTETRRLEDTDAAETLHSERGVLQR